MVSPSDCLGVLDAELLESAAAATIAAAAAALLRLPAEACTPLRPSRSPDERVPTDGLRTVLGTLSVVLWLGWLAGTRGSLGPPCTAAVRRLDNGRDTRLPEPADIITAGPAGRCGEIDPSLISSGMSSADTSTALH